MKAALLVVLLVPAAALNCPDGSSACEVDVDSSSLLATNIGEGVRRHKLLYHTPQAERFKEASMQIDNQSINQSMQIDIDAPVALQGMGIFVLNLKQRTDRLEKLTQVLQTQAPWMLPNICRINAPDGLAMMQSGHPPKEVDPEAWNKAVDRYEMRVATDGGNLTPGAIGLTLGHGLAWEHVQQRDFAFSLVMEDDITSIHPGLQGFLSQLATADEQPWDYLQFQGDTLQMNLTQPLLRMEEGTVWNTGLYALRREVARTALNWTFPITADRKQLDDPEEFLRGKTQGRHSQPAGAMQDHSGSDVQVLPQHSLFETGTSSVIKDCDPLIPDDMVKPGILQDGM